MAAGACGDSEPVCGDGVVEGREQCDDGNRVNDDACNNTCYRPAVDTTDLVVRWSFNTDAAPGFTADSCSDMDADRVVVQVSGPAQFEKDERCSFAQVSFRDVPPGTYDVSVRVLGDNGDLLTGSPVAAQVDVADEDVQFTVDVPFDAWVRDYLSTFFFRVTWAGDDCDTAKPAVVEHVLLLEQDGRPLGGLVTDADDPVDGSARGECRSVDTSVEEFPQSVREVPFGPVVFEIVGFDADGGEAYRQRFETFAGAGISNPELVFDVDLVEPGDGNPLN